MNFNTLLKQYIKKQNISTNIMAAELDISRSYLQNLISDRRKMTFKYFDTIISTRYFTASQVERLSELYFAEMYGEKKIALFNLIEKGTCGKIEQELSQMPYFEELEIKSGGSYYSGKKEIISLIHALLNRDKIKCFVSNYAFENNEINKLVYNACKRGAIDEFYHAATLDNCDTYKKIEAIFNILHYAELGYLTYNVDTLDVNSLMPYFMIVDDYLLMYDESIQSALLLNSESIGEFIYNVKSKIAKNDVLAKILKNPFELMTLMETYVARVSLTDKVNGFCTYMFSAFVSEDILDAIATQNIENIPFLKQKLLNHYEQLVGSGSNNIIITYEALCDFAEKGILRAFPLELAKPVPLNLRAKFLKDLLDEFKVNDIHITNPIHYSAFQGIGFDIFFNCVMINASNKSETPDNFNGKQLFPSNDDDILDAFNEFFEYFNHSVKTYSKEESIQLIKRFITELEAAAKATK